MNDRLLGVIKEGELAHYFPNFLLVGAGKSGTSYIDRYLREHPQVCMPQLYKELNYFYLDGSSRKHAILKKHPFMPTNVFSYLGFFNHKKKGQVSGECSPSYFFYYNEVIEKIKEVHPFADKLKIIYILREPLDKIWSHYKFVRMHGLDPQNLSLKEALAREDVRRENHNLLPDLYYRYNTSYYQRVKAYQANFENVLALKYEDLKNDPDKLMEKIFTFLEVDPDFRHQISKKVNASIPVKKYKNRYFRKMFTDLPYGLNEFFPERFKSQFQTNEIMDLSVKRDLAAYFLREIQDLQNIVELDLEPWILKYQKILNG